MFGKFEEADFKYDHSFFRPKYTQIKYFLVPNLGIFIPSRYFVIRQIRGR